MPESELPKGYRPELPASVDLKRDFAEYHASCKVDNGVLIAERRMITKMRSVPVSEFQEYKSFLKSINDERNQYIVLSSAAEHKATAEHSPLSMANAVWNLPASSSEAAQQAENESREAFQRGDVQSGIASLQRAINADPKFTRARLLLGGAYFGSMDPDAGLQQYRKAISEDPKEPLAYKMLAFAQLGMGTSEAAIKTWQELLKVAPDDGDAAANLGSLLLSKKNFSEAVSLLGSAVKRNPESSRLQLQFGIASLHTGNKEQGAAALLKSADLNPDVGNLNNVAYELADDNQKLPEALEYAKKAVKQVEEDSQDVKLDSLEGRDLNRVIQIGMYWDTLGWVYFRMGDLENAAKFLSASWTLTQDAVVGDHLGQVYERQHKPAVAIHTYALALANGGNVGERRQRLLRLWGSASRADGAVNSARAELGRLRTVRVSRVISSGSAEFFLLFAPGPKVESVRFISGSEGLRPATKTLAAAAYKVPFPDDCPSRLLRRGVLVWTIVNRFAVGLVRQNSGHS